VLRRLFRRSIGFFGTFFPCSMRRLKSELKTQLCERARSLSLSNPRLGQTCQKTCYFISKPSCLELSHASGIIVDTPAYMQHCGSKRWWWWWTQTIRRSQEPDRSQPMVPGISCFFVPFVSRARWPSILDSILISSILCVP
jgi:hypothetical protein